MANASLVRPADRVFRFKFEGAGSYGGGGTPDKRWSLFDGRIKETIEDIEAPETATGNDYKHSDQVAEGVKTYASDPAFAFPLRISMRDDLLRMINGRQKRAHLRTTDSDIAETNDGSSQLSAWIINNPIKGTNTDSGGELYVSLTDAAGTRTVSVFKDSGLGGADKVCEGSLVGDGTITLAETNSSGMTGEVVVAYTVDDVDIQLTISNVTYDKTLFPDTESIVGETDEGADVETTVGMRVAEARFTLEKTQPVNVELDFFGKSMTTTGSGTATSGLTAATGSYYKLYQAALLVNSITYKPNTLTARINNGLFAEDHRNAQLIDELPAMFQTAFLDFTLPWGSGTDEAKVLKDDFRSSTDRTAYLTLTSGSDTIEFFFPNLRLKEDARDQGDVNTPVSSSFVCESRGDNTNPHPVRIRTNF